MKIVAVRSVTDEHRVRVVVDEELVFGAGETRPAAPGFGYDGYTYELVAEHPDGSARYRRTRGVRPARDHSGTPAHVELTGWLAEHPTANFAELRGRAATVAGADDDLLVQLAGEHFAPAVRFSDPTHLAPKSGTTSTWAYHRDGGHWPRKTLLAAGRHMSENSDASDMVSLALSEAAFLHNADVVATSLIYGGADGHAEVISSFLLPKGSFIHPDDVEAVRTMGIAGHRSRGETEVLFYGAGLAHYVVSVRPNPYGQADLQPLQHPGETEDAVPDEPTPVRDRPIDTKRVVGRLDDFRAEVRDLLAWLATWEAAVPAVAGLRDDLAALTVTGSVDTPLKAGQALRRTGARITGLDRAGLSGDAAGHVTELVGRWEALLLPYR
ncbi:hypothetical protein ACIGNX_03845 [Actinosynnema sp. NPDC053489]|uniref:hypothetical protein n=1 Tax=Actinosynnema sp. NPDC053489 TaxID=3363916 RepID=UPI0037C73269